MGISRKVDELGRVVIPVDFRKELGIEIGEEVDIFVMVDSITIKKAYAGCLFCKCGVELVQYGKYYICASCRQRLAEAKDGDCLY